MRFSALSTYPSAAGTYGGKRDLSVDVSNWLESGESISGTPTVTSSNSGSLTIGAVTVSGDNINFSVTAAPNAPDEIIILTITVLGDAGSADVFFAELPLERKLGR